ncbi:MAG: glycosyltransferase family protein [Magnetococcales bacterium]|nr:glycosyltransferase family protein [Magnetococcales bacterium]
MNANHQDSEAQKAFRRGQSLHEQGQLDPAIHQYQLALQHHPQFPEALTGWGRALLSQGQVDEGLGKLVDALQIQPDHVDALVYLAQGLVDAGQQEDAIQFFLRALDVDSDLVAALHGLGRLFFSLGRWKEAGDYLRRVVERVPDHLDAWSCLGMVSQRLGDWNAAEAMFRHVLRVQPEVSRGYNNFGSALLERGDLAEAARQFQHALVCRPDDPLAINNLGVAWQKMGDVASALEQFRLALQLKPDYFEAANNMGLACQELGRLDDALECFRLAQRIKPDFADAHFNEGVIWLTRGDFARGWRGYEWRLGMPKYRGHRILKPAWEVTRLAGRRVLVYCEQGFGDNLQFIRYVGHLVRAGATVVVACPGALARLFATVPGVAHWMVDDAPAPECDDHILLLSLPLLFDTGLKTVPAVVPYLWPDPVLVERLGHRLARCAGLLKIGVVWRGNPEHLMDRHRSMPPEFFSRLSDLEGCCLVGLQKGATAVELEVFAGMQFLDMGDVLGDFADTAAVVAQLDGVIAVDTAVAHLAGAMGKPVWLLLSVVSDWRWMLDREETPWYPTMRLLRQSSLGDWSGVMDRVKGVLDHMIHST